MPPRTPPLRTFCSLSKKGAMISVFSCTFSTIRELSAIKPANKNQEFVGSFFFCTF